MNRPEPNLAAGSLNQAFNDSALPVAPKRAPRRSHAARHVVSFRVNDAEKTRLQDAAGSQRLGIYAREQLLGPDTKRRKTRGRAPVKDHEALAAILSKLGRSELATAIGGLLLALEEGRVHLSDDQECCLRNLETELVFIRTSLVKALGLRP